MTSEIWEDLRKEFLNKIPPNQEMRQVDIARLCGVSLPRSWRFLDQLVKLGEVKMRIDPERGTVLRYLYTRGSGA